ncbi:MAG: hypothetical protein GY856_29815, partial [bacterium]|nr:hypothetical protein [bacterium]
AAARDPFSDRLCDGVVIAFALWTLCSHAVVATGGTLVTLIVLYAVAGAALVALRLRFGTLDAVTFAPAPGADPCGEARALRSIRGAGLLVGLAGALAFYWHRNVLLLWWWIAAVLAAAVVASLMLDRPAPAPPARGRWREGLLWTVAVACAVLTLIAHRSDPDDSFYVNIAVAAVDLPGWALLSTDTLHGIAGLPLHLPVYRLHSYELLNGALSYLTGIPAIYCFHWLAAAVAAVLVTLAHAKLFRVLTPRLWPWAVTVQMLVLFAAGETHRWHGNFAFVRMWQGKAILLSVLLPLIYTYALRFALRPNRRDLLLLGAAQISALGCTSSAIWAAPAGALMALSCGLRPTREGVRTLVLGVLASAYVVGAGWLIREEVTSTVQLQKAAKFPQTGDRLHHALAEVLGDSRLLVFGIAAIAVAWACCSRGLVRRFAMVLPFAVWMLLLNPYIDRWVSGNLIGPSYWRILWAIPIPLLMTLLLISPLCLRGPTWWRAGRWAACLLALVAFVAWVPRFSGISRENRVFLKRPQLKVPLPRYVLTVALYQHVGPGSQVAAPDAVGLYLPTFHHHPHPLMVRHYLKPHAARIGADNYRDRRVMTRYLAGEVDSEEAATIFRDGLARFPIRGVCLRDSEYAEGARAILREAGFLREMRYSLHEIWLPGPASTES